MATPVLLQVVDAVVADPPYGVRAGGRKGRARPEAHVPDRATHHAALEPYTFGAQLPPSALCEVVSKLTCLLARGANSCWPSCGPCRVFLLQTCLLQRQMAKCVLLGLSTSSQGTLLMRRVLEAKTAERWTQQCAQHVPCCLNAAFEVASHVGQHRVIGAQASARATCWTHLRACFARAAAWCFLCQRRRERTTSATCRRTLRSRGWQIASRCCRRVTAVG